MNAVMAVQKRSILYTPMGIALAVGGIIVLWSLMRGNPTVLVLLAIAVLFLLGFKRPLWAIAALLVSQFTITSYMVSTPFGDISLRLLLLILTVIVIVPLFVQRRVDLGPNARRLIVPVLVLVGISTVSNLVNSGFGFAFKDFRNMIVGLLIVVLLPAVIRSTKDLKTICVVTLAITTASAIVGLMQHYRFLGMDQATILPGILNTTTESRVPGMAESYLELSYLLSMTPVAILGICIVGGMKTGNRNLLLFVMILMLSAMYFTYTRSALYSLVLGIPALFVFLKTRIKAQIILGVLLLLVAVVEFTGILGGLQFGGRSDLGQEESALSRSILWEAGIAIAIDNPLLGIGGNQFTSVAPQYEGAIDPALLEYEGERYYSYRTLGSELPHNDFLNVWVSYGTLALLVYVWVFFVVVGNLADSYRISRNRFIKGISAGLVAALVVYGVNAFYHNLMITLPLLWILAGLSLAASKLATKKEVFRDKAGLM
jgi:O-antigen ligase